MTRMMQIFEEYLAYKSYKYIRLDGSTTIESRREMVQAWQTNPEIFIFMLSTRAGGLGLNLTSADTVIFYDSDWNPTIDSQAMDRAHRIGQTKQVKVFRLVTRNTIEQKFLNVLKKRKKFKNLSLVICKEKKKNDKYIDIYICIYIEKGILKLIWLLLLS